MSRASGCSLRRLGILAWAVRYVNAKCNWGRKWLRKTLVRNAATLKAWLRILGLGFQGVPLEEPLSTAPMVLFVWPSDAELLCVSELLKTATIPPMHQLQRRRTQNRSHRPLRERRPFRFDVKLYSLCVFVSVGPEFLRLGVFIEFSHLRLRRLRGVH